MVDLMWLWATVDHRTMWPCLLYLPLAQLWQDTIQRLLPLLLFPPQLAPNGHLYPNCCLQTTPFSEFTEATNNDSCLKTI